MSDERIPGALCISLNSMCWPVFNMKSWQMEGPNIENGYNNIGIIVAKIPRQPEARGRIALASVIMTVFPTAVGWKWTTDTITALLATP